MPDYLFPPAPVRAVSVVGEVAQYPVNRIFCVGRNYAAHAAEMGVEVDREKPFYFTKSAAHLVGSGSTQPYPPGTENYHFEMELAVLIGAPAFKVSIADAPAAVFGYACALDMTRRDLQQAERKHQRPWSLGKDVEGSALLGKVARAGDWRPDAGHYIHLSQNGQTRQDATLAELIWSIPEIISHLSGFYHLAPGDVILTGTPAGVGPVAPGDHLVGRIEGLSPIELTIGALA